MSEYKHGEPWGSGRPALDEKLGEIRLHIIACVNFCAGVEVPDKAGGLKELLEWVAETCRIDSPNQNEPCIEACCPVHQLGFCNQHEVPVSQIKETLAQLKKDGKV